MATAYITDTRYAAHTLHGHPEHAGRLQAIQDLLEQRGITQDMLRLTPVPVTDAQILAVHQPEYLDLLRWTATQSGIQLGPDTYVLPESFEIARLSAGALVRGVDAVLSGEAVNALCCSRPPGHHATPEMAMGFCLLGNVAIGAQHARQQYGLQRVMIMDIDVHHGNGTQDTFYADPNVLFISTHQYPWYPGTGAVTDIGPAAARGYTVNIPLSAGVGDAGYRKVYEQVIWPVARRFAPDLILVSAGFDAHWADPLCQMRLTLQGYNKIVQDLIAMAAELCGGKIVFALEGGYNLTALSHGVLNVAHALIGSTEVSDPLGAAQGTDPDITPLLERLRDIHKL